jgi:hypothetical protein
MGVYAKYLLPRIIDLAMRNKETARLRAAWIPRARGEVLEVGIGSTPEFAVLFARGSACLWSGASP